MTDETLHWSHEFRSRALGSRLFETRSPALWIDDLFGAAGFERGKDFTENSAWHLNDGELIIVVDGTPRVLGFVCVLLNQHAEQSPSDATPVDEGRRLERTLEEPGHLPLTT